jgi:enoyl-[acyl-carrier protein] reductase III
MELSGKTAIVTGSARGIGRAIALRFANDGADVVINYVRSTAGAQEVAKAVRARGRQALVVQADVSQRSQTVGWSCNPGEQESRCDERYAEIVVAKRAATRVDYL